MTKTEWKKLYSNYRKSNTEFYEWLSSRNLPCGTDDYYCEQFDNSRAEFVDANPVLKQVLEIMDQTDHLAYRWQDWHFGGSIHPESLKRSINNRLVA
jgi:hypothetical protein